MLLSLQTFSVVYISKTYLKKKNYNHQSNFSTKLPLFFRLSLCFLSSLIPLLLPLILSLSLSKPIHSPPFQASVSLVHASFLHSGAWVWWLRVVVFAVVLRFLAVGFGFLMIFLVGSNVWLDGFGFWGFLSFGFYDRRWFSVVVVVSSMGWICN